MSYKSRSLYSGDDPTNTFHSNGFDFAELANYNSSSSSSSSAGNQGVTVEDEPADAALDDGDDADADGIGDVTKKGAHEDKKEDGVEGAEGPEEVHGEYERDEVPTMGKKSFLYGSKMADHQWFLNQAPLTRGDALRGMTKMERFIFEFLILLTPLLLIAKIWQFAQKSVAWLWARTGRITGSTTGTAVGQQRGTPIMKGPFESLYAKFKGNKASKWGSGKEVYGTQCYCNDFKRLVTTVFREQRASGAIQATMADGETNGYFTFRNQKIPVPDINNEPSVEVRHYGLLIDPWNHQRGVSPDGVCFINGLAVGVLEVKCAYANDKSLYVNVRLYYFSQLMNELYLGHILWPTIHWLDFVVWSPQHFTVDTYTLDTGYFYNWYAPRELKFYFGLFIKTLAEKMYLTAQQETKDVSPSDEMVERVITRDLTMPFLEPPPPPPEEEDPNAVSGQGAMDPMDPIDNPSSADDWEKQLQEMDLDFAQ